MTAFHTFVPSDVCSECGCDASTNPGHKSDEDGKFSHSVRTANSHSLVVLIRALILQVSSWSVLLAGGV